MNKISLASLTTLEVLALFGQTMEELRGRGIVRTANNPVADYTEGLVASALSLKLVSSSTTGYDAEDSVGERYEIKGRRLTKDNGSTQLSVIRGLELKHFTFLAGVLFNADFSVLRACLIHRDTVVKVASHRKHVNGWIIHLRQSLWGQPGVQDLTDKLRMAQNV